MANIQSTNNKQGDKAKYTGRSRKLAMDWLVYSNPRSRNREVTDLRVEKEFFTDVQSNARSTYQIHA